MRVTFKAVTITLLLTALCTTVQGSWSDVNKHTSDDEIHSLLSTKGYEIHLDLNSPTDLVGYNDTVTSAKCHPTSTTVVFKYSPTIQDVTNVANTIQSPFTVHIPYTTTAILAPLAQTTNLTHLRIYNCPNDLDTSDFINLGINEKVSFIKR